MLLVLSGPAASVLAAVTVSAMAIAGVAVSSLVFDVPKRAKWRTSYKAKRIRQRVWYLPVGLVGYAGAYDMARNSDATYYAFLLWWGIGGISVALGLLLWAAWLRREHPDISARFWDDESDLSFFQIPRSAMVSLIAVIIGSLIPAFFLAGPLVDI